MAGVQLEDVAEHRYLGVTLSNSLSWNPHVDAQCSKANRLLGLLRRNLSGCSTRTKTIAYQALVRPHLEYSAPAWDPHTVRNIRKLEQVQRRAARFVANSYSPYQSVTALLVPLNWQPLQVRRQFTRLTVFYRMMNNTIAIPSSLVQLGPQRTRSAHPLKCQHVFTRIDPYKLSFIPRTIIEWNRLPCNVATSPSTDSFKTGLSAHLAACANLSYPQYKPY